MQALKISQNQFCTMFMRREMHLRHFIDLRDTHNMFQRETLNLSRNFARLKENSVFYSGWSKVQEKCLFLKHLRCLTFFSSHLFTEALPFQTWVCSSDLACWELLLVLCLRGVNEIGKTQLLCLFLPAHVWTGCTVVVLSGLGTEKDQFTLHNCFHC